MGTIAACQMVQSSKVKREGHCVKGVSNYLLDASDRSEKLSLVSKGRLRLHLFAKCQNQLVCSSVKGNQEGAIVAWEIACIGIWKWNDSHCL